MGEQPQVMKHLRLRTPLPKGIEDYRLSPVKRFNSRNSLSNPSHLLASSRSFVRGRKSNATAASPRGGNRTPSNPTGENEQPTI